jgi:hypothetical protein
MGFLDKAKAAATELAAKADGALANAGLNPGGVASAGSKDADRLLRDLGIWTLREASGQADASEGKARVLNSLRQLEASGQLPLLQTSDQAPPPPGAAAAGFTAPPPPAPGAVGSPPPPPQQQVSPAPADQSAPVAPPPPPSWATKS